VLNYTRSEAYSPTKQPERGTLTPTLGWVKIPAPQPNTPYTPSKPPRNPQRTAGLDVSSDEEEFYDWPDSDAEELAKAVEKATEKVSMPPPETPRKTVKMTPLSTPGTMKRNYDQVPYPTPTKDLDDVFSTPSTNLKGRSLFSTTGLQSPEVTPTTRRLRDMGVPELTNEVIDCLQNAHVGLGIDVIASVKDICKRHMLRTKGCIRGRDATRAALAAKDVQMVELQNKTATLEEEKEMMMTAMRQLRRDLREATANDNELYA